MAYLIGGRRAALDGLMRILDAGAPEELFAGPEDEAAFLYALLVDTARARRSSYYAEICRAARRRGVTPEYVVDRAVVLLTTMEERRRADLYRVLGVPALASAEMIRQRWLDLAKQHHPDAGGDGVLFRHAKVAYEVLRDPARRAEYERFWLRALGPFERVAWDQNVPPLPPTEQPLSRARPLAEPARERASATVPVGEVLARLHELLAPLAAADLDAARADVARSIEALERVRTELRSLATLKTALGC